MVIVDDLRFAATTAALLLLLPQGLRSSHRAAARDSFATKILSQNGHFVDFLLTVCVTILANH
jgi:hypothetical protein